MAEPALQCKCQALKCAQPSPFQEPGSGHCAGPHSRPSYIGSFYNAAREQRSGLFLKGQPCNTLGHTDLKGPAQAQGAMAVVTLLLGQEEARDMHPGEQLSVLVLIPRADPCSVFCPEAAGAMYDPCLPLKSFQAKGHRRRGEWCWQIKVSFHNSLHASV